MLENITLVNQGGGYDYDLDNQSWTSSQQISGDVPAAATPGTYKIRVVIDGQGRPLPSTRPYRWSRPSLHRKANLRNLSH